MRKFFALLLTLALLLALAACGGGDTPGESTAPNQSAADPGKQATETTETQPQEVQDTPFGEYLSEEEILAMLESGELANEEDSFRMIRQTVLYEIERKGC